VPTVSDILRELEKPGRDPRPAFRTAAFAEGVETMEDLAAGMVLEGVVTNVAAFGAFVDIGVHQDGLVHVSAMSKNFVSDPREVAKPGDVVRVRVLGVDLPRKRISLTLRLDDEPDGGRAPAQKPAQTPAQGAARGPRPPRPAGDRAPAPGRSGRKDPRDRTSGGVSGRPGDAPSGAMADALRRAGLAGDEGGPGDKRRRGR
jgi:uncharacterized protein